MLIIFITIFSTSAARATHSLVNIENNSKHRSFLPVLDLGFKFGNGNGHQLETTYSYPKEYDSNKKLSDVVFPGHGSKVHRRVDSEHNYQYPYENRNGQWNRPPVTEATQFSNRFEGNGNEANVFDYLKGHTTHEPETIVKVNEYGINNRPMNNSKNISTELDDVKINQQNAYNYTERKQTTIQNVTTLNTTRKPNFYPIFINQYNSSIDQSSTKPYHNSVINMTKTNMFTTETYKITTVPNTNIDSSGSHGTNTTQDNEVPIGRSDGDGDRWIWENGEAVETTTLVALDDRAAFAGNNCPTGTVRVKDKCIAVD